MKALAFVHKLRLVEFTEARGEQQPLAGEKRFILDQMRLETEGILDEPEATAIVGPVLDLDCVLTWTEIGCLPKREFSVTENYVSCAVGRSGRRKRPDSSWTSCPLRIRRLPVCEEDQKEFVAQIQYLETAGRDVEVEASVSWGSISAKPRESTATSCWCVIPCGAMKPLEKL